MNKKTKTYIPVIVSCIIVVLVILVSLFGIKDDVISSQWKTYTNSTFGYSFEHPDNFIIRDEGVSVWPYDESKRSQYVHASADIGNGDFGITVVVNPMDHGMCEGSSKGIPDHVIGTLTFSGCEYENGGASESTSFDRGGDHYSIFIGYPVSLRKESYKMAASFKLND